MYVEKTKNLLSFADVPKEMAKEKKKGGGGGGGGRVSVLMSASSDAGVKAAWMMWLLLHL